LDEFDAMIRNIQKWCQ